MSYHLEMEKSGKTPKIEMPPIEQPMEEISVKQDQQEQEQSQNYEIHPEIAQEMPIEEIQAKNEAQLEPEEVIAKPKSDSKKEEDLRKLREKAATAERYERERDELYRKLQEVENKKQQPIQQKIEEKEEEFNLAPDDYVEAKYLKKYDRTIKELKEELNNYKQQTTIANVDAKLKAKYPDIDSVVSRENLEILKSEYPELSDSINSNQDLYSKASAAYTLIKRLGIAQEDHYVEDKIKAQKNATKPRPLASVNPQQGDSPLSKANSFANGLTDDLKAQLRREMDAARKNM